MASRLSRLFTALELEERILNAGVLTGAIGVFLPWISDESVGEVVSYSGFRFYTSFLGLAVFCMYLFMLALSLSPALGGPVILRKRYAETVRMYLSMLATILLLAALSVLTKVTFEFVGMEVRFGIYVSLVGSIVASLYSMLRYQEQRKKAVHDLFHHPDDRKPLPEGPEKAIVTPPPPPPPAPSAPEEHHLHPRA